MKVGNGTRLGPYEIGGAIGAGGMGEVFLARDTRLERSVAIKVIPPHLAANDQLLARFEREARVVSSLSHPNICTLYDVGEVTGEEPSSEALHYFVMELVEGETLEQRLRRGPLPLREVIAVGAQIARALEHAHARGVIHRDLKPSNIMLTGSGVKLLDFGLSKMLRESESEIADDASRTVQRGITEEGVVLGTFQYMSPEQAEGKPADQRTDIFALGAVLYEMVSGRRAFEGSSRASLIAAIMAIDPPDVTELRPDAPPALEKVIASCLEKDPDERWQSAHDVRLALEMASSARGSKRPTEETSRWRYVLPWTIAALAVIAALALLFGGRESGEERAFAFEILPGESRYTWENLPVTLSPDGRSLLVGMWNPDEAEGSALYVRDLDSLEFRKLGPQGSDLYDASWSWNGDTILFHEDFELKRIPAGGGIVTTIARTGDSRGASWGPGGLIVYAPDISRGIHVIPAEGGEARIVTEIDKLAGEVTHARPCALPDGKHFLFLVHHSDPSRRGIYAGSVEGTPHRFLVGSDSTPVFAAPDRLLYHHQGSLYAQVLDMDQLTPVGAPKLVAENVAYNQQWDTPGYSASQNGVLAYHQSGESRQTAIHVYDRSGQRHDTLPMTGQNIDLSRDGSRLAVQSGGDDGPDIWVWELDRGIRTRLTSGTGADIGPVWSPDERWIAYTVPGNPMSFYRKRSSGIGEPELIFEGGGITGEVVDWSVDGRWLLLELFSQDTRNDVMAIDLESDPPALINVVATTFDEDSGRFSPDGRWLSYEANDSGRDEVFVQPFPPDGRRWQVSIDGGSDARWNGDGSELYWVSRGAVMVAAIDTSDGFRSSNVRKLFDAPSSDWVVHPSGERFFIGEGGLAATTPIIVDTEW